MNRDYPFRTDYTPHGFQKRQDSPARAIRAISDSCEPVPHDVGYWVAIAVVSFCTIAVFAGLASYFFGS